jgi:hypothetical protein
MVLGDFTNVAFHQMTKNMPMTGKELYILDNWLSEARVSLSENLG